MNWLHIVQCCRCLFRRRLILPLLPLPLLAVLDGSGKHGGWSVITALNPSFSDPLSHAPLPPLWFLRRFRWSGISCQFCSTVTWSLLCSKSCSFCSPSWYWCCVWFIDLSNCRRGFGSRSSSILQPYSTTRCATRFLLQNNINKHLNQVETTKQWWCTWYFLKWLIWYTTNSMISSKKSKN